MIKYSIVSKTGKILEGEPVKTCNSDINQIINHKKSVVCEYEGSYEIITPVGNNAAIIHNVKKHEHSSLLLRVLSFYCVGWALWMWTIGGIATISSYEGINAVLSQPQNEAVFYLEIIAIGIISFLSSFGKSFSLIGFTLQAAWWLFLTMFFIQNSPNTAIFIYGSYFLFSLYGMYTVRKR